MSNNWLKYIEDCGAFLELSDVPSSEEKLYNKSIG